MRSRTASWISRVRAARASRDRAARVVKVSRARAVSTITAGPSGTPGGKTRSHPFQYQTHSLFHSTKPKQFSFSCFFLLKGRPPGRLFSCPDREAEKTPHPFRWGRRLFIFLRCLFLRHPTPRPPPGGSPRRLEPLLRQMRRRCSPSHEWCLPLQISHRQENGCSWVLLPGYWEF